MFLRRTRRISTNGKLSNAATAAVEMLEGRVLLAYTLDPSFDGDGIVNGAGDGTIVVQPDSKVVARVNGDHAMRRFNVDGSIDTSFGGGTVTTPLTTSRMDLSGGKLIVAGYDSADQQSHLARYNLNGTLDTTFGGGDGLADVPTGIESLEIAPDGKLVVLGEHYVPNPNIPDSELPVFDIVRFNSDGSLDTSFSGDGSWEAQPGPAPFGGLLDGAVQSDGKIIAGAWDLYSPNEGREYWTFRVNADGTDDSTFHSFFGDTRSAPYAGISTIEALPDDRFLMGNAGRVERYLPDGTRDTTFATNTLGLEAADGYPTGWVNGLKPLADGKTLVAGLIDGNYGSPGKAFVARILADGNPDSSFSGNSRGMLVLAGAATTASSPHLDAQNRVIVGGTTSSSSGNTYWLARLADLPQTPYNGTPFKLNDTIQAEDFDRGGEGVAYHDSDSTNNGGAYRPADGVDIEPTSDTGGGYDVGWTMPGEWLEYSVDLGAGGSDLFAQLRLASPKSGGMMRFVIDAGTADAVEGEPFAVPKHRFVPELAIPERLLSDCRRRSPHRSPGIPQFAEHRGHGQR
ncbi:MAG TPA: carbohydrate-binding domain-containing protein [Tepidisphaeraceae bacterium]|jgi:uncharacterized delta-60 repeat protein|nr:carbohydrate-binding domain-containing protein [Tepidisphaeraceae bacterium]